MIYDYYCAACMHMSETNSYAGKFWCDIKWEYRDARDTSCFFYDVASNRSNEVRARLFEISAFCSIFDCYLTTIMCHLLDYPDDNYYLNTLRRFRDNFMKKDSKYFPLLITYDIIGPIIAKKLGEDSNGKEIALAYFNNYIIPSTTAIEEKKYETAINIYKEMTYKLAEYYNIDILNHNLDIKNVDMATLGHGKIKKKCK